MAASECLEIEGKRKTCMYEDPVTKQKGCERLTGDRAEGVAAIGRHCTNLSTLRLEDCEQLPPPSLLPAIVEYPGLHTAQSGPVWPS